MPYILIVLLFSLSVFSNDRSILNFLSSEKSIPQSGNSLILPNKSTYLKQLSNYNSRYSEQFYLRRRFSKNSYGLYLGLSNQKSSRVNLNINRFILPSDLPVSEAIKLKLYLNSEKSARDDIADVYFYGNELFLEGASRVFYYKHGIVHRLDCYSNTIKTRNSGDIVVNSNPKGAQIFIDGRQSGLITPNYIRDIKYGYHSILLKKRYYNSKSKRINVVEDSIYSLDFNLISKTGAIKISGTKGALIRLNGRVLGNIPYSIDNLIVGEYQITVTKDFYKTFSKTVEIKKGGLIDLHVDLPKNFGVIKLPNAPRNCPWRIDNREVASGNIRMNRGVHRVNLLFNGNEIVDTLVSVSLGDTTVLRDITKYLVGRLKILPFPLKSKIYMDNKLVAVGPCKLDRIYVGIKKVVIRAENYTDKTVYVTVNSDETVTISPTLTLLKNSNSFSLNKIASKEPSKEINSVSFKDSFSISFKSGRLKELDTGVVAFVSYPPLAKVYCDGLYIGVASKLPHRIVTGYHVFSFIVNGKKIVKPHRVTPGKQALLASFE